mgnify:CR=1 FL=1
MFLFFFLFRILLSAFGLISVIATMVEIIEKYTKVQPTESNEDAVDGFKDKQLELKDVNANDAPIQPTAPNEYEIHSTHAHENKAYNNENIDVENPKNTTDTTNKNNNANMAKKKNNLGKQILLSFSMLTNFNKLFSINSSSGTLKCINGIRVISTAWVVMGHTYSTLGVYGVVGNFVFNIIF